jgi:hypothetical protein
MYPFSVILNIVAFILSFIFVINFLYFVKLNFCPLYSFQFFFRSKLLQAFLIKGILRPSHVCFICGTLPTGTLTVCIPNLFPPKENHNVGLLRFDDDHDHICYRFAQVQIFGGKSNVFKSLQLKKLTLIILERFIYLVITIR